MQTAFAQSRVPLPQAAQTTDDRPRPNTSRARRAFREWWTGGGPARLAVVLAGILIGQAITYGPSLIGRKILLPLDYLGLPGVYLPETPGAAKIVPHDMALSDLVLQFETDRRFATAEIRAGRFPFWAPYQYAGAPFVWPKYSPLLLFQCLTESPVIVAWAQLLAAFIAGSGAYMFCRRALRVKFWAAAIPAWCYPLCGFLVFWQGFPTCGAVYWMPWLLLAVHRAVRHPRAGSAAALACATGLVLVSGHIDVAGQVLLVSGLYGAWQIVRRPRTKRIGRTVIALVAGWALGFMLAAPQIVPMLEYARTGARMAKRSAGAEDRPPGTLAALPQVVLPDMFGTSRAGSLRIARPTQIESSAAAYSGLIATLFAAPLAWCNRRRRTHAAFFTTLAALGLGWCLGVPGLVQILRLPGLNMMSHNRLVLATAFAITALAALGLDALLRGEYAQRAWFALPATLLAAICAWAAWRAVVPPEPIATLLEASVRSGRHTAAIATLADVAAIRSSFFRANLAAAILAVIGVAAWVRVWLCAGNQRGLVWALGIVMLGDMCWFAAGRSAQCDPALYFPRIPALEKIAHATPGRAIGYSCLPAQLAQTHGLNDVRGYDSIDPARMLDLLKLAAAPESPVIPYAMTQWLLPRADFLPPDGIRLSPILDMLGVRHVIFRGTPPAAMRPVFQSADYWVLENKHALPRAFIPHQFEAATDDRETLAKLSAPDFDPRKIAYIESPVPISGHTRGTAKIIREAPTRVTIAVQMESPGVLLLADNWDSGWNARVNGKPATLFRANHTLRSVLVQAGRSEVEFRYEPASATVSFWLTAAALALVAWAFATEIAKQHAI